LHAFRPPEALRRFDFTLRHRSSLFDGLSEPWTQGPFGEPARQRLNESRGGVEALLREYDRLVEAVLTLGEPWVVTHGEPHSANFVVGRDGGLHLIDWDTARLAPPERDLAALPVQEPAVLAAYLASSGRRAPGREALRLFQMWWDASEICGYIHRFRGRHNGALDDQASWDELTQYLRVEENWPDLV
jgi:spectinomycin phosphotransferase